MLTCGCGPLAEPFNRPSGVLACGRCGCLIAAPKPDPTPRP